MSHRERNFAQRIRQQGYRFTPQRQLILDALCDMGRHATVDEIYEAVNDTTPSINLATVYRTVRFLEELRLVVSADIQGKTVYEIVQPTPHHHLVCRACGDVQLLDELPLTMLVSPHHMHMVRELFPRTIVMDEGQVVADGPTAALMNDRALLEAHGLEQP